MGGMFSSAPPVDLQTCRNNCISKCSPELNQNRVGENPPPKEYGGGGKRRKSKGFGEASRRQPSARAKRKASKKRRH